MNVMEIDGLRKRAQRTRTKIQSEILFGKVRHSEVNHLTVTRIVGSHVECQKRVQTYRGDLTLTLNNIKRQQCQLRRTMAHYSRKLRHNRKEREERKKKEKMEAEMKTLKLPSIVEEAEQNADDSQSEGGSESDSNGEENVDTADDKEDVEQTTEAIIPTIKVEGESNEESKVDDDTIDKDEQDIEQPVEQEKEKTNPMDLLTKNLQGGGNDPPKVPEVSTDPNDFNIEMYSKKKRKRQARNVNYSDLIKLRHSTNKKKLFSLVDKLSKVHGPAENANNSRNQLKNGKDENVIEPARKTSIFYPINYGYDVPDEPEPEVEPPKPPPINKSSKEKTLDLPYNSLFSEADNNFWRKLHQTRRANERSAPTNEIENKPETKTERRRRRASDLPLLIADYSDIKNRALKTDSEHHSQSRERVYHSAKSRYRQPRLLPPIVRPMKF